MVDLVPLPPFSVVPRGQVYLGMDPAAQFMPCWSAAEDSVGIVGPPRYGKSSGVIIPAIMNWNGPVVSTSTRGDLLQFCGAWRQQVAQARGGRVYVYDPFASEPEVTSVRWSPLAGCDDPTVCYRRVSAMVAVVGRGISDGEHWRAGAAVILRACFHAAALSGRGIVDVRRWLARQDTREPAEILRTSITEAVTWADDLQAVERVGDRERGSFFSVARNTLDATAEPRMLASAASTDLDVDEFLRTGSTLFIVGPSHYQQVAAPMIVGLVDSIAQRAAEVAAATPGGRLSPGLLLALDEVANIAPLQSLPALVSEGGGRGIVTMWAAQSLSQLRARYGADEQQAILTATTAKLIFGGMSNGNDLRDISAWAGEYREPQITFLSGATNSGRRRRAWSNEPEETEGQHSIGGLYRPVLPIDALQQLPPLHAWLFYRSDPPLVVQTRPAGLMEPYRRLSGLMPDPVEQR